MRVLNADGKTYREFESTDKVNFTFRIDQSGALVIYRIEESEINGRMKERAYRVFAPGVWTEVLL